MPTFWRVFIINGCWILSKAFTAFPLLGVYLEKTLVWKDTCTPMFIAMLLKIAKTWKQPKCPSTDKWIKKMCYIYIYNGILLSHNNEIMPFAATWTDLEIIILSEVSQKKTNIIWYHLYVESKKMMQMNYLHNRNRLIDIENKLMVTKGDSDGGR